MDHLVRCLDSIRRHTDAPIVVTDMWSHASQAVKAVIKDFDGIYVRPKVETKVWSRSIALNLAAARPTSILLNSAQYYVFTDADMLFPETWFEVVKRTIRDYSPQVWLTRSRDLSPEQTANLPLPWMPPMKDRTLYQSSEQHPSIGQGAGMLIPIRWFKEVGGFDEVYSVWGAEDNDLVLRARWSNVPVSWLEPDNEAWVVHQYHTRTWPNEEQIAQVRRNREYLAQRQLEQGPIIRNREPRP